ncbi:MAG: hypothetical protein F6J90_38255 [Moorea sp. SIOASIH]|uniref:hypothetical protein n=1 Tax=Moorena sp. SIOASIH TaxID=2607817 RepID=UPI0013BD3A7C|nr:hypothetical protein [Moorena sp. SIOASIH]NEO41855.1 hypothetical protein [Moorena sp. SIOASIH]
MGEIFIKGNCHNMILAFYSRRVFLPKAMQWPHGGFPQDGAGSPRPLCIATPYSLLPTPYSLLPLLYN